jgi:glycine cleavage system H protein
MAYQIPEGFKYTRKHEWARQESSTVVAMGITDYAQDKLGSIVFVELPEVGQDVLASSAVAVIESVKAVADTYSPVDGAVTELNEELLDHPELLNEDPYGAGWMVRIEVAEGYNNTELMTAEEYTEYVRQEDLEEEV